MSGWFIISLSSTPTVAAFMLTVRAGESTAVLVTTIYFMGCDILPPWPPWGSWGPAPLSTPCPAHGSGRQQQQHRTPVNTCVRGSE